MSAVPLAVPVLLHRCQLITESDRLVLCAMIKALDRNVGYIVDALERKVT